MKYIFNLMSLTFSGMQLFGQNEHSWPFLKHYNKDHLYNIALPQSGIGTGTVLLGGRGELRDWEIMNKPGIGHSTITKGNNAPFFSIFVEPKGESSMTRALVGPVYPAESQHYKGRSVNQHGFPYFGEASFGPSYPIGIVNLSDETMPVVVKIIGFNPFIPGDADASGLPVAVLNYEVTKLIAKPIQISVCGSLRNFVGKDNSKYHRDWNGDFIPDSAKNNHNEFRKSGEICGIYMYSDSVKKTDTAFGTIALVTSEKSGISYRWSSEENSWGRGTLDFWNDFSVEGELIDKTKLMDHDPLASLPVKKKLAPNSNETFRFFITWNFPNRYVWSSEIIGNYYSTKYTDVWDAAQKIVLQFPVLELKTRQFMNAFISSSLADVVKVTALFNHSTLRSQTVFRTKDGHLIGWESVMDEFGSCFDSCTHVWNYEVATSFLFDEFAQTMRDVEFGFSTDSMGLMSFRTELPLEITKRNGNAAADGQMGTILKFYREWQLSENDNFLKKNWDNNAFAFAWIKGGWDSNVDGVMEGCQHNIMDVEYYGPNPQMEFWYLGDLRAGEEMAKYLGDKEFATKCRKLFESDSVWTDANLFNRESYIQEIRSSMLAAD